MHVAAAITRSATAKSTPSLGLASIGSISRNCCIDFFSSEIWARDTSGSFINFFFSTRDRDCDQEPAMFLFSRSSPGDYESRISTRARGHWSRKITQLFRCFFPSCSFPFLCSRKLVLFTSRASFNVEKHVPPDSRSSYHAAVDRR